MSDDAAISTGEHLTFAAAIEPGKLLGLSLKNGLLNIVTLTLYRFWGRTEVRRRIWNGVHLNGEPFEYTGRGLELFLGFVFASLVVGLPFLLIVFGAQLLGPVVAALVILPLYLGLFVLLGFARFRAFRYLASRTVWRGIRFQLVGSAAAYGWKFLGYILLSGITLGWFGPAAARRLAAPLWGGLKFGDRPIRFDLEAARKVKVYSVFALGWIVAVIAYFLLVGVIIGMAPALTAAQERGEPPLAQIGMIYLLGFGFGVAMVFAFAPYQAAMLRSIVAGLGFDDARFRLALAWTDLVGLMISNLLISVLTLGFLFPVVEARTARFLIRRLSSLGLADLAAARQAPGGPRTGEGLADAFGVVTV